MLTTQHTMYPNISCLFQLDEDTKSNANVSPTPTNHQRELPAPNQGWKDVIKTTSSSKKYLLFNDLSDLSNHAANSGTTVLYTNIWHREHGIQNVSCNHSQYTESYPPHTSLISEKHLISPRYSLHRLQTARIHRYWEDSDLILQVPKNIKIFPTINVHIQAATFCTNEHFGAFYWLVAHREKHAQNQLNNVSRQNQYDPRYRKDRTTWTKKYKIVRGFGANFFLRGIPAQAIKNKNLIFLRAPSKTSCVFKFNILQVADILL